MSSSRLPGFYQKSIEERQVTVAKWADLSSDEVQILAGAMGLSAESADHMVENAVGTFGLPLGIRYEFPGQRADAGADGH
jgi:hydroxymethylglutaryl-CoA reductase